MDKRTVCVISRTLVSTISRSFHAFCVCEMGPQLSQTKAYMLLVMIFLWALQLPLYFHICKKTKWSLSKSHPNYNFSQTVWRRHIFLKQHTIWHPERDLFGPSQNGMSRPILLCIPYITLTSKWARLGLKSPASRLFTQSFIHTQVKWNIIAPRHWPFRGEFTMDRWFTAQRASNAENVYIWWRHHDMTKRSKIKISTCWVMCMCCHLRPWIHCFQIKCEFSKII